MDVEECMDGSLQWITEKFTTATPGGTSGKTSNYQVSKP